MIPFDPPPSAIHQTYHLFEGIGTKAISSHSSDKLRIGYLWKAVQPYAVEGRLHGLIAERRKEISSGKAHWKARVDTLRHEQSDLYGKIDLCFSSGKLVPIAAGEGAAYLLFNHDESSAFIVKPVDEDIFCLNNRKQYASPFIEKRFRVRAPIPLYRSAQTDVLAWRVATLLELSHLTPKTVIGIYSSSNFYDITDCVEESHKEELFRLSGRPDREKLCSIQEFFPHTDDLKTLTENGEHSVTFDQKNFEELNLLIWVLYDNDAHGGNILTYIKEHDAQGKPIYGLKKIDNGLSFPERNAHLVNLLTSLPNAFLPLSDEIRTKIFHLPLETIAHEMRNWEMEGSIDALIERATILKTIAAEKQEISIREINLRLAALELPDGKNLALSPLTYEELEDHLNATVTPCSPTLY